MREVRILVVGSSVLDNVIRVHQFPEPGESVRGSNIQTFVGGKGSNQAVAAARLGASVTFAGAVGNDPAGQELILRMRQEEIKCDHVRTMQHVATGCAFITLNALGQNTIAVSLGANESYSAEDAFKTTHECLHDVLLLQGEIPIETSRAAAEISQGIVIFNPAPALAIPPSMFHSVDYLTPNEHEAAALTSLEVRTVTNAFTAAENLLSAGCRNVVITMGAQGAVYMNSEHAGHVKAPKVHVVDTVGAGDTFNGALAFAVAQRADLKSSVEFAVECASVSVTQMGAQTGMPYFAELRDDVKDFLRNQQSV
jgi:ribokinase